MRATFFGIEMGKRGILAQRAAMDVTSHNITNANTEGYARQRPVLSASSPWMMPDFYAPVTGQQLGTGVEVEKIMSLRDAFIDEKIVREKSTLENKSTADDLLKQVEAIMNEPGETSLRDQLDKFWAAWENLSISANRPELRRNLTEEAQTLVSQFKDIDLRLRRLQGTPDHAFQGSIEDQLEAGLKEVNTLAHQLADVNVEIGKAEVAMGSANDLRDKRQKIIEDLSKLVNVEVTNDSRGLVTVRVGRHTLVQHGEVKELFLAKKTGDEPGTISDSPDYPRFSEHPEVADAIMTHTQDYRNFTVTVAQLAQSDNRFSALTFHPLTGPLSGFGVSNGTFSLNGRTFTLDATKTNMDGLVEMINQANVNVNAKINESGQLVLDSAVSGVAGTIDFQDGTSNLGTILNLQVGQKAQDAVFNIDGHRYITSGNVVRDAVPGVTFQLKGPGVTQIDMRPIVTNGKIKALLQVRDGNIQELRKQLDETSYKLVTEVNYLHRQGFGLDGVSGRNFFKAQTTSDPTQPYKDSMKNLEIEEFIIADLNTIAASQGTYVNETDRLPTYNGDGDGKNAILIARVKQANFFMDGKANFNDYINTSVTQVATASQRTERERGNSNDLLLQLDSSRESISGVSLDEELTNLIKYQHAYNAASKVISTVDEMLDKIINGMLR